MVRRIHLLRPQHLRAYFAPIFLAQRAGKLFPHAAEAAVYLPHLIVESSHSLGVAFVGLGGSLPCPVPTLNESSEEETAEHLDAAIDGLPADVEMVFVTPRRWSRRATESESDTCQTRWPYS